MILAAIILYISTSCKKKEAFEPIDFQKVPVQIVKDVSVLQTNNGEISMRMMAPLMEKYSYMVDSVATNYDYYSNGFYVYAYTEDGELETRITANAAKHVTTTGSESWSAFGNVVVINYINRERMESDTIYWDKANKMIHTDCYVKLSSPSGLMQGFGMQSDERARNATILNPFDSYSVQQDSTKIYIDSINFIGPLMQRF